MRFIFSLFMLLATVLAPTTQAFPSTTNGRCDISVISKHPIGQGGQKFTANTRVAVSTPTVTPGGQTTITLSNANGGFNGFMLYVTSVPAAQIATGTGNAHVGTLTGIGAAAVGQGSQACNNNAPAGSTLIHSSPAAQASLSFTWTAPANAAAGTTYSVAAAVAEQPNGLPPIFYVTPVTITIAAAQAPATQAPPPPPPPADTPAAPTTKAPTRPAPQGNPTTPVVTNPTIPAVSNPTIPAVSNPTIPAVSTPTTATPTKPSTIKQAYNMVLVRLKAVLNGTGSVAQLKAAIQALIKQIQAAIQAAKAAQGMANANQPVNMIVTKAPAAAGATVAAAGAGPNSFQSFQLGFVNPLDASIMADLVTKASSPEPAMRSQSSLTTSGDLASQLQADPAGQDANGVVTVAAANVAVVTCPDGTIVSQDMMDVMCPAAPAAAAGPALSNMAFIGIIVGGVVLLLVVVGGLVYYQKSKVTKTLVSVVPRV